MLQLDGAEKKASILQLEEQAVAKDGKDIVYYKQDIDYKQEGPDPNYEPVAQEEEKEDKMELSC